MGMIWNQIILNLNNISEITLIHYELSGSKRTLFVQSVAP